MDESQKEQNRSKWKASVRRGRGRGRRGGGLPGSRAAHGPDLDSNYNRYVASNDEAEGAADTGDGLPVSQSQGADLQQLLAESEQFYGQAHFRYRSFIEAVDTEPPLVDVAAFEEELVIQPGPLIKALSRIPLNELLGLSVPAEFLQEGSWDDPPMVMINKTDMQQHFADAAASLATLQPAQPPPPQQQHVQPARLPPHLQQQQQTARSAALASQPTTTTAAAAARKSEQPPAAATASKGDDDTDELLELLLSGGAPPPRRQPAAPAAAPAAAQAASAPAQGARSSGANPMSPAPKPGPPTAAAVAAPKASAAAFDDELDALLGLGPSVGAGARQLPKQDMQATGGGGSKKESLEDWLDGF